MPMRTHALQALVGGVIGIAAGVVDLYSLLTTGHVPGMALGFIAAPILSVLAVREAFLDRRVAKDETRKNAQRLSMLFIGVGSFICCWFMTLGTLSSTLHIVAAAILLSALLTAPRDVWDPLL